jgi:pimeloyl-ACP methyl ester carboxylesterase
MRLEAARRRLALPGRGVELALLDFGGQGPLALLSHANGFCAALWAPVAAELTGHFHVIAFDSRGHGDSSVPRAPESYHWDQFVRDLIALAERLMAEHGRAPLYGIGHSFGGTCTMAAASRRPDLFARVAMLDPVLVPPPELWPRMDSAPPPMSDIARKRQHVFESREAAREKWRDREPFSSWDPRAFELYLQEGLRVRADGQVELKCAGEVEAAVYEHNSSLDLFEVARELRVPTLLLFAGRGHFSRLMLERLCALSPALRSEEMAAGHLMLMESPEACAERLIRFGLAG